MKKLSACLASLCFALGAGAVWPQDHSGDLQERSFDSGSNASFADILSKGPREKQLLRAAEYCDLEEAKRALSKGGDVDARDSVGETPLMIASKLGYSQMANLLLNRGANIKARANDGVTALHLVVIAGQTETAKMLIERGADTNAPSGSVPSHFGGRLPVTELEWRAF